MEYLGIDLSCALGSLRHGKFPDKDCLLPLISKLLGYAIVAASTTVKLPQACFLLSLYLSFFDSTLSYSSTRVDLLLAIIPICYFVGNIGGGVR